MTAQLGFVAARACIGQLPSTTLPQCGRSDNPPRKITAAAFSRPACMSHAHRDRSRVQRQSRHASRAEQLGGIEIHRVAMIGIHVLDGLCSASSTIGIGNVGQKLLAASRSTIRPKPGDQMRARRPDPEKRKILKIYKGFGGRMGVEIAPAQNRLHRRPAACSARPASMIRAPSSGSPSARSSSISETRGSARMFLVCSASREISRIGEPSAVACDVDQRAIGIAAARASGSPARPAGCAAAATGPVSGR